MKLSKIKFAQVIGFIERQHALNLSESQIQLLDDMIDVDIPEPEKAALSLDALEYLMSAFKNGSKIEAIKGVRSMTGLFLKEAKDLVEKHWTTIKTAKEIKNEMVSCILNKSNNENFGLKGFNADELDDIRDFIDSFSENVRNHY